MIEARLPRPSPRAEFRAAPRAQLVAEAPRALVSQPRTAGWWRPLAAATATIMLVAATGSAAAESLPDEAPFAIKRSVEETRLFLATDGRARVDVLADHAQERLAELQRATLQARPTAATEASSGLAQALGRLALEVERLQRATPSAPADGLAAARTIGRAERLAVTQSDAIEQLIPTAAAPVRLSLERAVEQAKKIRSRDRR